MLLGSLTTVVWIQVAETPYAIADILLPTAFVALTVWHGLTFRRSTSNETELDVVVRWFTLGIATMFCLGMWPVVLRALGQQGVPVGVRLLTEIIAGGLFGVLVGRYSVRARRSATDATQARLEQRFVERQREISEVLNGMLRHHILNSLTVIRGRAELLERPASGEDRQTIETIIDRADEMARTVEEIGTITRALTGGRETEPVPLRLVLESRIEALRAEFDDLALDVGTVPECEVRADDVLGTVFDNVLTNAVEHNDSDDPTVAVDAAVTDDAVVVTVADDGPGIPEQARDRVFEANERGLASDGAGLGLYLSASVLDQYGGGITVCDADLGGAAFELTLPRASEDRSVGADIGTDAGTVSTSRRASPLSLL